MADEEGKKEEAGQTSDEGKTQNTDTSDGDKGQEGPSKKKLEESSAEELIAYIKELRTESKDRRLENAELKEALGDVPELKGKLKELEDKGKTEDELKAERLKELESAAGKLPELERLQKHVKATYTGRMKAVKEMGEEIQSSVNSLLEDMPKDDYLGRLKILDAVLAVSGGTKKPDMKVEETGNPAEIGAGESGKTMAGDLAWSPQGGQEAILAGLVKPPSE
jgi:hypothetical protein